MGLLQPSEPVSKGLIESTRVIDAIQINGVGLNQNAQLQQMVPIATIAGHPRSRNAQSGADFPGTQASNQTIEPWPGDRAAGGSPQFIIYNFNLYESTMSRFLNQVIPPTLAL